MLRLLSWLVDQWQHDMDRQWVGIKYILPIALVGVGMVLVILLLWAVGTWIGRRNRR